MLSEVGIPFEPMNQWIIWGMTRVCLTCHFARLPPVGLIGQILETADRLLIYGSHLLEDGPPKKRIQNLRTTVDGCEILHQWYMVYPIITRVSTIQGGAGFLPSTVWDDMRCKSWSVSDCITKSWPARSIKKPNPGHSIRSRPCYRRLFDPKTLPCRTSKMAPATDWSLPDGAG